MRCHFKTFLLAILLIFSMGCGSAVVGVPASGDDPEALPADESSGEQDSGSEEDMGMDATDMWGEEPTDRDMDDTDWEEWVDTSGDVPEEEPILDDMVVDVEGMMDSPEEGGPVEENPAVGPDPGSPGSTTVKTMNFRTLHWNIGGGKENACATARITRAVMRYVRSANGPMDFVSLNEVCEAQYHAIRRALKAHWGKGANATFSAFQPSGKSRVGVAIFSRQNLRAITRLEVGQDKWGKRYLLCGRQINRRVRVCTTHLTPGDSTARKQLVRVLGKIESWWHNKRDTVIIGGDFNIQSDDHGFNKMYSARANTRNNGSNHGHYREWDDNDPNHCKGYGQRSQPGTTRGPCRQGSKIDFIFARENRIVNGKYGARTLDIPNDCTGVCSDHRAVRGWAKIRFRTD